MRPIILCGHQRPVTCVKINRDGDLLWTTSMDATAMLWQLSNGERIGTYNAHNGAIHSCDVDFFSKYLLTASGDGTVKLWQVDTGLDIHTYTVAGDHAPRRTIQWACGDKMFMYTAMRFKDNPCRIIIQRMHDLESDEEPPEPLIIPVCKETVQDASFSPNNKTILCVAHDGLLREYDTESGDLLRQQLICDTGNKEICSLRWSPDHTRFLIASRDRAARMFDAKDWNLLKTYTSSKPLNCAIWHPEMNIVAGCGGQKAIDVALTKQSSGKFEVQFFHTIFQQMFGEVDTGHYSPLNVLTFFPDGTGFVTGADEGNARIFNFDESFAQKFAEIDRA